MTQGVDTHRDEARNVVKAVFEEERCCMRAFALAKHRGRVGAAGDASRVGWQIISHSYMQS